jgi:hypothetical protein
MISIFGLRVQKGGFEYGLFLLPRQRIEVTGSESEARD